MTGNTADIFFEYIQRNLPEGVSMSVEATELESMPDYLTRAAMENSSQEKRHNITFLSKIQNIENQTKLTIKKIFEFNSAAFIIQLKQNIVNFMNSNKYTNTVQFFYIKTGIPISLLFLLSGFSFVLILIIFSLLL